MYITPSTARIYTERGSAGRSPFKVREGAVISPKSIGTVLSKATLGKTSVMLGVAHNVGLFRVRRYNYLNPFTAMLAPPSLRKRPTEVRNLKSLGLVAFSHEHVKGFLPKGTVLKVDLLQDHQIYCFQACMCAFLSTKILQAGAVKGLK